MRPHSLDSLLPSVYIPSIMGKIMKWWNIYMRIRKVPNCISSVERNSERNWWAEKEIVWNWVRVTGSSNKSPSRVCACMCGRWGYNGDADDDGGMIVEKALLVIGPSCHVEKVEFITIVYGAREPGGAGRGAQPHLSPPKLPCVPSSPSITLTPALTFYYFCWQKISSASSWH